MYQLARNVEIPLPGEFEPSYEVGEKAAGESGGTGGCASGERSGWEDIRVASVCAPGYICHLLVRWCQWAGDTDEWSCVYGWVFREGRGGNELLQAKCFVKKSYLWAIGRVGWTENTSKLSRQLLSARGIATVLRYTTRSTWVVPINISIENILGNRDRESIRTSKCSEEKYKNNFPTIFTAAKKQIWSRIVTL